MQAPLTKDTKDHSHPFQCQQRTVIKNCKVFTSLHSAFSYHQHDPSFCKKYQEGKSAQNGLS